MHLPAAVVLNFHKAALTARCVKSLLSQVDEIVVVDNSASDAEFEKLSFMLEPFKTTLTLVLMRAPTNLGFGRGVDHGIDHVSQTHDEILIINNDAVAHPDMVACMRKSLIDHNNNALVAACSTGPTPTRLWYHRILGLVLKQPAPGAFAYLSGACLLVPRSLAHPALFDHDFFMYGEDVELGWRMTRSGTPLVVSEGRLDHVGSASSGMNTPPYEYFVAKGHILLAKKLSHGSLDRVILTVTRLFTLSARAILRCARFGSFTPLRALTLALFTDRSPNSDDKCASRSGHSHP